MNFYWKYRWVDFICFSVSFLAIFLAFGAAQAAPLLLEKSDTKDEISDAQLLELETRAKNGDWQLKMEFAAAYLYDKFYPGFGCDSLRFGFRCRAMAKHFESGRVFLKEIIDTTPNDYLGKLEIGMLQEDYAYSLRYPFFSLENGGDVCREKIHYYELAVRNGSPCAASFLEKMARYGTCMEQSKDQARLYQLQIRAPGCPEY
jgi:hypothetical protein